MVSTECNGTAQTRREQKVNYISCVSGRNRILGGAIAMLPFCVRRKVAIFNRKLYICYLHSQFLIILQKFFTLNCNQRSCSRIDSIPVARYSNIFLSKLLYMQNYLKIELISLVQTIVASGSNMWAVLIAIIGIGNYWVFGCLTIATRTKPLEENGGEIILSGVQITEHRKCSNSQRRNNLTVPPEAQFGRHWNNLNGFSAVSLIFACERVSVLAYRELSLEVKTQRIIRLQTSIKQIRPHYFLWPKKLPASPHTLAQAVGEKEEEHEEGAKHKRKINY